MSPTKPEGQSKLVEELVTAFKRRGHFDALRKSSLSAFQSGVSLESDSWADASQSDGERLVAKLKEIVQAEVKKDSSLLHKDRSKSSILIGGAVDRFVFLKND
jgi:COMPASS (Complex proteins associated with Set1p) component shg1